MGLVGGLVGGALLGGALGGGGQSKTIQPSSQTTTSNTTPWRAQQPYLKDLFKRAQVLQRKHRITPYSGDRVQNFDPRQRQAFGQMEGLAGTLSNDAQNLMGSLGNLQGIDPNSNLLTNQYLSQAPMAQYARMQAMGRMGMPTMSDYALSNMAMGGVNPYLQQNVEGALGQMSRHWRENIMPGIGDEAQAAGQYGSSRQAIAEGIAGRGMGETMANTAAQMYGQAYESDAARRLQAAQALEQIQQGRVSQGLGAAGQVGAGLQEGFGAGLDAQTRALTLGPSAMQTRVMGPQMLRSVGDAYQQQAQAERNAQIDRYYEAKEEPWNRLAQYGALVAGGNYGSSTSSKVAQQQTMYRNPLMSALGGGMSGYAMGSMAGFNPLLGAGLGAMMGWMG